MSQKSLLALFAKTFEFTVVENNVDPDPLASEKPADLDLHRFQNWIYIRVQHEKGLIYHGSTSRIKQIVFSLSPRGLV